MTRAQLREGRPLGGAQDLSSPQRQISYLALPLPLQAALRQQENVFDGATDLFVDERGLEELEAVREWVVVSGGWAWHFMSPPAHAA